MPVGRTFGTHLRCQVDWQAANDCVARLDNGRIQMGNELVNLHMLARSPFDGTGVAGDEVGGHGDGKADFAPRYGRQACWL